MIESFLEHGQLVPALGRPVAHDPDYDIELIYGARRLFVARHLNKPLLVEVRPVKEAEGIVAMDIENRHRVDISPYERGLSYLRWLRAGYFDSQDHLAKALNVSASQVSRLVKLASLPTAIVAAFRTPVEICETWAMELAECLDEPQRRRSTLTKARAIAASSARPSAREVYRQLLCASVPGRKIKRQAHDKVVGDERGKPLFRIRHQSNTVALLLPVTLVSAQGLERIRDAVREALVQDRLIDPGAPA